MISEDMGKAFTKTSNVFLRRNPVIKALGGPDVVRDLAHSAQKMARTRGGWAAFVVTVGKSLPGLVTAMWGLARDPDVAWRYRLAIMVLVPYVVSPIDPIPDFTPVIGGLDDAAFATLVITWVIRNVDRKVIERHWHGSTELLDLLTA